MADKRIRRSTGKNGEFRANKSVKGLTELEEEHRKRVDTKDLKAAPQ